MTPEQVRELAATVRYGLRAQLGCGPTTRARHAALTALTDELLRHLGAPRVPTKISKARLAELVDQLEYVPCKANRYYIDQWNAIWHEPKPWKRIGMMQPAGWWRMTARIEHDRSTVWVSACHPTLRAALEAPVVRRAGCPPVIEFEVEA